MLMRQHGADAELEAARMATRRALIGAAAHTAALERRNALREGKGEIASSTLRDAVLAVYGSRCAISQLPEPRLLDAAHIVKDADEALGQPIIPNGLPLLKILRSRSRYEELSERNNA
jgi:hypothetical protein